MEIKKLHRRDAHLCEGVVVVIDVIRAFTTAAFAFHQGAEKIILVASVDAAFELHKKHPKFLLMGEVDGMKVQGFNFGNSPYEISKQNLTGKTLIQRTSSGTQGVYACRAADKILTASFVVAKATCKRIIELNPKKVNLLVTGESYYGVEDEACADYIEACLKNSSVNPLPYIQRVHESPSASRVDQTPEFKEDMKACASLDTFDFAMEVFNEGENQVLKRI
jgi:2-phosphosulfolactate phosphatase